MQDEKESVIAGVGPDAPVVENAAGGKQSDTPYRLDLLPAKAVLEVAAVLKKGAAKYEVDNWRQIECKDHLNHALVHAFAYLAGDCSDEHLSHFACRALMALEMNLLPKEALLTNANRVMNELEEEYARALEKALKLSRAPNYCDP